MANYDQAKYDAYHATAVGALNPSAGDAARETRAASLTERLETLNGGLAECHGLLDRMTGVGSAPNALPGPTPIERGAFLLVEEALGQMVHLRKRLDDLSERVGRL